MIHTKLSGDHNKIRELCTHIETRIHLKTTIRAVREGRWGGGGCNLL